MVKLMLIVMLKKNIILWQMVKLMLANCNVRKYIKNFNIGQTVFLLFFYYCCVNYRA